MTLIVKAFPIIFAMPLLFFCPWRILISATAPSPKHHANAYEIIVIGKTTDVAALPRKPSLEFPMNI